MNYNAAYFIIIPRFNELAMYLKPLKKTARRNFDFERLEWGEEPLFFENAFKDEYQNLGRCCVLPDVSFYATIPILNDSIRNKLKFYNFSNVQLYPTVFIDDNNTYHENLWCMNFWEELDCLDREKSKFSKRAMEKLKLDPLADGLSTYKYSLDSDVLDKIPEEERLIFKMGPDDMGYVFVHQKIADIFFEEKATGVNLVKVSDFEEGMQF
ncbi:hypothetical protein [Pseudoalteromonas sp. JC3]|uniref:hypothetical protein n=1 Tax=unclassified Pseudoalteromonas TaxID=194690 RepID=UPI002570E3DF|nr:hypothetical protein [Pseudoalteromonas sp. JC3]WJE08515.1 hypothetical protein QSH61_16875 [Pseudoalteromonas sp. JC3]